MSTQPIAPPAPPKPSELALWLFRSTVTEIRVERRWTKDDGSDEVTTVFFIDGHRKDTMHCEVRHANSMVDFTPNYCSACRLHDEVSAQCRAWVEFTQTNADKLAEYLRLKIELGL